MPFEHPVTVRLWGHIEPIERGERYEDPLQSALSAAGAGEVDGGGSQLSALGEVTFAEIAAYVGDLDAAVPIIREIMEGAGAPEGSEIIFAPEAARPPVTFGTQQVVAVYLDGVSLPADVYETLDFDSLLEDLEKAFGSPLRGNWPGPQETALYYYGSSAEAMFADAEPTLGRLPICQNARVVLRQGHPSLPSRTVRLPRH